MIMVKIEMWPHGSAERKRDLAAIAIWNVGGDAARGDYRYAISHQIDSAYGAHWADHETFARNATNAHPSIWKSGSVSQFVRARGAVALLTSVLKAAFFRAGNR